MKTIGTKRKLLLASALGAGLAIGQGAFAQTATTQAPHAHKAVKKAKRATAPVSTRSAATVSPAAPVAVPAATRSVSAQR
ncbi:hypothetical protein, partial [Asaia platycodi]|uniref:hypothetical protein n=1 Tax=Asaia platycodi TaxID=610243 RepID=UPI0005508C3A